MGKIYGGIDELIGATPMVRLSNIEKEFGLNARILAKVEFMNPAGSVKDRVALEMINDAEQKGILKPDSVIIEPTSGNTGIGLAAVAAVRGYRAIIIMPDTMSVERIKVMQAYGAEVVLTDGKLGMTGAIAKAEELAKEIEGAFIPDQFKNPANPAAHLKTTGPEIFADTEGEVDFFVAGAGTGGTVSGVGEYLKSQKADIKIVAVEPENSAVLSGKPAGAHGLQGIGAGFIPEILNTEIIDEIITVTDDEAYEFGRMLGKKEGLLVGISAGAALCGAVKIAKKPENAGKTIVTLLPDTGLRYLSTKLFE